MTQEHVPFAHNLHVVQHLLWYDGPLLSHQRTVDRIVIQYGDMFDGTVDQFQNSFFSNFSITRAQKWLADLDARDRTKSTIKFHGKDYLITWADIDDEKKFHIWTVTEVTPELLDAYFKKEKSLLKVMKEAPAIYECHGAFIDENGTAAGKLIAFSEIPGDRLPTVDSYCPAEEIDIVHL